MAKVKAGHWVKEKINYIEFQYSSFPANVWNYIDILKYAIMSQNNLKEESILRKSQLKINK